jgi:hypothetical protein
MNFDVSLLDLLTLLVDVVLPILVGLVTTRVTPGSVQAVLLAFLTMVTGFVSEWIENGVDTFNWKSAIFTWLTGFVVAVATHFGLWKPTGVTALALDNGRTSRRAA